jgi:hypothetical protein
MPEPTPDEDFQLAANMGTHRLPEVVRNWADLVVNSDNPAHHAKYVEVMNTLRGRGLASSAAIVNVVFDMSGAISATTTPAPITIEADDQRQDEPTVQALPAPVDGPVEFTDLATLLGLQEPVDLEP